MKAVPERCAELPVLWKNTRQKAEKPKVGYHIIYKKKLISVLFGNKAAEKTTEEPAFRNSENLKQEKRTAVLVEKGRNTNSGRQIVGANHLFYKSFTVPLLQKSEIVL